MVAAYPRTARLLNSKDFEQVFRHADLNTSSGPLRLRAIQNRMPRARLGVVVSKRGNAKAVRRNRIKRIIRERFRLNQDHLPDVDIAIQVFAAVSDEALVQRVDNLFLQVKERFKNE
ncbi:MAG: ribonuclease P protein component [Limisphaerales bacterium]|jgi:ribonuclease P protein component